MASKGLPGQPGRFGSGDDVPRRLERIDREIQELGPSIAKSFQGTVAAIQQAQADLEAAQAGLAAQQAELEEVVLGQVGFLASDGDVAGPFTISSSAETQITQVTFEIPDGFVRALVVGYGSVGLVSPSGSSSSVAGSVYIEIGGSVNKGPLRYQSASPSSDVAVYPYKQRVITGVTGGETVTVSLHARSYPSDWTSVVGGASLNVQAYFSRA